VRDAGDAKGKDDLTLEQKIERWLTALGRDIEMRVA